MTASTTYRYPLATREIDCPQCHRRRFKAYLDGPSGPPVPGAGRCNRVNSCGFHVTPSEAPGWGAEAKDLFGAPSTPAYRPADVLPADLLAPGAARVMETGLAHYLATKYSPALVAAVLADYGCGLADSPPGAIAFPQVASTGELREVKVTAYAPDGHRVKGQTRTVAKKWHQRHGTAYPHVVQCMFGEHLLYAHPEATVVVVESEKTALVAALEDRERGVPLAERLYLATGGSAGARWNTPEAFAPLRDRVVYLDRDDDEAGAKWDLAAEAVRHLPAALRVTCTAAKGAYPGHAPGAGHDLADVLLSLRGPTATTCAAQAAVAPALTYGSELSPTHEYVALLLAWRAAYGTCTVSEARLRREYPEHADEALHAIRSGHVTREEIRRAAPAITHALAPAIS